MNNQRIRIGVDARLIYDGDLVEVVETRTAGTGLSLVLRTIRDGRLFSVSLAEALKNHHSHLPQGDPEERAAEPQDVAATILTGLTESERQRITERAAHVREVLTGYRSGSAALAAPGEPQPEFNCARPFGDRYRAKAAELGVSVRTIKQWVANFRNHGEAGLANPRQLRTTPLPGVDDRWMDVALEVMVEHTGESRPSRIHCQDPREATGAGRSVGRAGQTIDTRGPSGPDASMRHSDRSRTTARGGNCSADRYAGTF